MTKAEKLQSMENLWTHLTRDEQDFESPAWHESVLAQREEQLSAGQESPIDWEVARKELRYSQT
jgi:hypothetical protein